MTSDKCFQLEEGLRDPRWVDDWRGLITWLDGLNDVEGCIAEGLGRAGDASDWLAFERYLLAAYRHPSRSYTATLCEVLGGRNSEVNNEDIVDVLAEIRDPSAVSCLGDTMHWEPGWDEFHALAVKCVRALASIGTTEARTVLEDALNCGAQEVRDATRAVLGRPGL